MKVGIARVPEYQDEAVRTALEQLLVKMGHEAENPFGELVRPGDRVFIKPNWVAHEYRKSGNLDGKGQVYSVITHPSLIRAVADLVAKALKGKGQITIGDNPSIDADFPKLMELVQLDDLKGKYDVPVRILDLRPLICTDLKHYGKKSRMTKQPGDPEGHTTLDLGERSAFCGVNPLLFRGVFDSRFETVRNHVGGHHRYAFSNSICKADVYISLPKLKTHHKVGVTLNLKGLVGINAIKNYVVHWRVGWPAVGGDEYPDFFSWLKSKTEKIVHRGAWEGNDTAWRMVVDLYDGLMTFKPRTFSVIDGILGGEHNGPFLPLAKPAGVIVAGSHLVGVDCVATRLMGLDYRKVHYLQHLVARGDVDPESIEIVSNQEAHRTMFQSKNELLGFKPPEKWESLSWRG